MKDENKNENSTFEKVQAVFQNYLTQDDYVEVIQTSHGYAVIEWDNRLGSWTEIEHCPSPAALQENLSNHMASYLEYRDTLGQRNLTDYERVQLANRLKNQTLAR